MNIAKIEKNYNKINLWLIVVFTLIGLTMAQVLLQSNMITPLIISSIFFIITNKIYGKAWKYFATNSPMVLGKFYVENVSCSHRSFYRNTYLSWK